MSPNMLIELLRGLVEDIQPERSITYNSYYYQVAGTGIKALYNPTMMMMIMMVMAVMK